MAIIVFFVLTGCSGLKFPAAATSISADDHVHFEQLSWQRVRCSHGNAKSSSFSQTPPLPCVDPLLAPGIICYPQTYPLAYVPTLRVLLNFLLDLRNAKR